MAAFRSSSGRPPAVTSTKVPRSGRDRRALSEAGVIGGQDPFDAFRDVLGRGRGAPVRTTGCHGLSPCRASTGLLIHGAPWLTSRRRALKVGSGETPPFPRPGSLEGSMG